MERDQSWSNPDWCAWLELVFACLDECLPTSFPVALLHLWFCWLFWWGNNLWANCGQVSNWSNFFLSKVMVHPCMASRLCIIVASFYSPVRNIFLCISLHDLPCHKTMKILFLHRFPRGFCFCQFFYSRVRNPRFEHTSVLIHNILANLTFSLSATQIKHGQRMILVLPNQSLSWEFSKSDWCSVSCLPVLYRPHTQMRIVLFSPVNE